MIESLIRPHIRNFQAYHSARSEVRDAEIYLDANELSLGSPVKFDGVQVNRYPDPSQEALRAAIAARLGRSPSMIFAGVGSDEIIDLLIRLLCEPGKEEIIVLEPTYGVYRVAAEFNNVRVVPVELDENFQIDPETTSAALVPDTKILFCCSPNNPTGNLLSRRDLLALCRSFRGLTVVDEAYVEFAGRDASLADRAGEVENLVVLRTLSKAWGLAGLRLGYCVANAVLVSYLLRVKAPYNINALSASLACAALGKEQFLRDAVSAIAGERERVAQVLAGMKPVVKVYPSEANFLLAEFRDPLAVYGTLRREGIIVRRRHEPRLQKCLRITIGTPAENDLFLQTIAECV